MSTIQTSQNGPVLTLTLNQPERRNAFNDSVIAELTQAFAAVATMPEVRVVVLAANGPAFCAGADLNWMRKMAHYSREENLADAAGLARMLNTIYQCPRPTIARIQGDVYAGGLGLVAACDLAVAVDSARFCVSEVKLGLIPATISPYLVRAIGARQAHRYFLTAEVFGAAEAARIGLVHEAVPADQLDAKMDQLLQALMQAGPQAVTACKKLLHTVAHASVDELLVGYTVEQIADIRASDEGRAGVGAFLDKQKPAWQ